MNVTIKTTVAASVDAHQLAEVLIENPGLLAEVFTAIAKKTELVKTPLEDFGHNLAGAPTSTRIAFATVHDAMRFFARQLRNFEREEEDVEGSILAARDSSNG